MSLHCVSLPDMKKEYLSGLMPLFAIDPNVPQLKAERQVKTTPAQEKLIDAAVIIRENCEPLVGYLSKEMILCTLPHSDPGNSVPAWSRTNRNLTLTIQPRLDVHTMTYRHPYGSIPRLLLVWMVNQVVKRRQRRVQFDGTFNDLLRQVGLDPATGGGRRSDRARFLDQVNRLTRATIRFDDERPDYSRWNDIQIAPQGLIWWTRKDTGDVSFIEFSEGFFDMVIEDPVPLDLRIAIELNRSPLAMDLYAWLSYTSHKWGRYRDMDISWRDLHNQLGGDYKELRQFRFQVRMLLPRIQALYPKLKIDATDEGRLIVCKGTASSVAFPGYRKRERENGADGQLVREGIRIGLKKSTEEDGETVTVN
jgi:hypothetical protein